MRGDLVVERGVPSWVSKRLGIPKKVQMGCSLTLVEVQELVHKLGGTAI